MLLFGAQAALVGALKLLWMGHLAGPKEQYLEELSAFVLAGLTRQARVSSRGAGSRGDFFGTVVTSGHFVNISQPCLEAL